MKSTPLSLILISALSLLQISCSNHTESDLWKEGELISWKFSDQLIINTKAGERRKHIGDSEFYNPDSEYFIGQFPIDYIPNKVQMLTEQKVLATPAITSHPSIDLEFNLMLNGSTVQATDRPTYDDKQIDHSDQVRVSISKSDIDSTYLTTKEKYLASLPSEDKHYDKSLSEQYGLKCYVNKSRFTCFGESSNNQVSGLILSSELNPDIIRVTSTEPIYGKIDMEWYIHKDNLDQWKKVDANIWRLLEAWNTSPINQDKAMLNNPREDLSKKNTKESMNGQILTFKVNSELIVSVNTDISNPYNRSHPNITNFLGQFSINALPSKQSISSISSLNTTNTVSEPLEFTFLLNGVEDYYLTRYDTKPAPNQIKVMVTDISDAKASKPITPTERLNYLLSLGDLIIHKESKFYQYGMECYRSEDSLFCIGRTNRYKHPELLLQVSSDIDGESFLEGYANTEMYGGVRVEWKANTESLENWLAIDTAIWRLLDEINIADLVQTPIKP